MEEIAIEEYRNVNDLKKISARNFNQMLVFCVTSLGAVLGFSSEIGTEFVPYILSPIILIASKLSTDSKLDYYFYSVYLLVFFEFNSKGLNFEDSYDNYSVRKLKKNRKSPFWHLIKTYIFDPFFLIAFLGFSISCYFWLVKVFELPSFLDLFKNPLLLGVVIWLFMYFAIFIFIRKRLRFKKSEIREFLIKHKEKSPEVILPDLEKIKEKATGKAK